MAGLRKKYESEVHLGFLVIICILLLLNFVSNFIAFKARSISQESLSRQMREAGLVVSRAVQEEFPLPLSDVRKLEFRQRYNLSGLLLVPSKPSAEAKEARRRWLANITGRLPFGSVPGMAEKMLREEYHLLSGGRDGEFFYLYPLSVRAGPDLLILSVRRPALAYLNESRELLSILLPGALILVLVVYLVLSRFIFSPFRKIKEQAVRAGRQVDEEGNEAEAVVLEYERVISSLKQKEAELLALNDSIQSKADTLEQLNQYLLSSSKSGIITLDMSGLVVSLNRAACELLMLDAGSSVGASCQQLMSKYPRISNQILRALQDEVFEGYREVSLTPSEGTIITVGMTVSPIRDNEGNTVGISVLLNDLTELTDLRREVEEKGRLAALGEMAGGLAHQLRNSMGAINGYGKLVKRRLTDGAESVDNIESLLKETHEAEDLIGRFLNFARPFDFDPSLIDLRNLIEETVRSFRVRDGNEFLEFSLSFAGDLTINADQSLLKQALSNMIENSIHAYSGNRGTIRVDCSKSSGGISIEIEDFGKGIPEKDLDKIFTPFFSSRPAGTGLGLPLASKIVHLHGGRITVTSEVGRGTTFCTMIPSVSETTIRPDQIATV